MKKTFKLLTLTILFLSLGANANDAGIKLSPTPSFDNVTDAYGLEWGMLRTEISMRANFENTNIDYKEYKTFGAARGPTNDPDVPELIMLFGFDKGRFAWLTELHLSPTAMNKQTACDNLLSSTINKYGPPTASHKSALIWQNEITTLYMYCTNFGPVLDWSSTLWTRYKPSFIPHQQIPKEVLNGEFSKKSTKSN